MNNQKLIKLETLIQYLKQQPSNQPLNLIQIIKTFNPNAHDAQDLNIYYQPKYLNATLPELSQYTLGFGICSGFNEQFPKTMPKIILETDFVYNTRYGGPYLYESKYKYLTQKDALIANKVSYQTYLNTLHAFIQS